jgi:hypothetical protein
MHAFRPRGKRIEEAQGTAQPQPGIPRPPHTAIPPFLALARIGQPTALTAHEHMAEKVQLCNAPIAGLAIGRTLRA